LEQDGVAAIPKAAGEANQRANLEAASLRLDAEDRAAIAALPKNRRLVDPGIVSDWDA
jgi:2,5-diketo-D-gluconate reductase B